MAEHIVGMQPNMLKVPKVPSEFQVSSRKKNISHSKSHPFILYGTFRLQFSSKLVAKHYLYVWSIVLKLPISKSHKNLVAWS